MAESNNIRKVNLLGLYQNTFGYIGKPWPNANVKAYLPNGETLDALKRVFNGRSIMGGSFFMPITIGDFELPNTPIVGLRGSKNIIEEVIDGSDGTFKEGFSLGDYEMTVKGILIDDQNPDEYPEEQVRALRAMYEERSHLRIANDLTTYFGIEYVAIYDLDIIGEAGAETYQPYSFKLKSDKIIDLEIKEDAV